MARVEPEKPKEPRLVVRVPHYDVDGNHVKDWLLPEPPEGPSLKEVRQQLLRKKWRGSG